MASDSVVKTVVTAAPHRSTSIPFKRVLRSAQFGPPRMANQLQGGAISRKRKNNKKKVSAPTLYCLNPNAAGVDVGATEIYIAVPVDRDPQPVRHFSTFTGDLHAACFAGAPAFTSWLGLCPDNRVSGGKVLSVKTRKVKNRAATALRMSRSAASSQSILSGALLSPHARQPRGSESHHRHGTQAGSHHLSHGDNRPGLR